MITFAAVLIWIVLGALAVFQGLLVLGAPLGRSRGVDNIGCCRFHSGSAASSR